MPPKSAVRICGYAHIIRIRDLVLFCPWLGTERGSNRGSQTLRTPWNPLNPLDPGSPETDHGQNPRSGGLQKSGTPKNPGPPKNLAPPDFLGRPRFLGPPRFLGVGQIFRNPGKSRKSRKSGNPGFSEIGRFLDPQIFRIWAIFEKCQKSEKSLFFDLAFFRKNPKKDDFVFGVFWKNRKNAFFSKIPKIKARFSGPFLPKSENRQKSKNPDFGNPNFRFLTVLLKKHVFEAPMCTHTWEVPRFKMTPKRGLFGYLVTPLN